MSPPRMVGEADGRRVALAGDAFARVDGAFLEVAAQRVGDHLAHLERGARGRVDLVAVVRLDDLDVVAGGERLGRHLEQLEGDVDAHAHVGRHHDRDVLGGVGDLGLLRVAEAGGADHGLHAEFAAHGQMRQRAFGPREVDQHLRVLQAVAQVGHDRHAAREAEERAGIGADGRRCRRRRARRPARQSSARRARPRSACGPCGRRRRRSANVAEAGRSRQPGGSAGRLRAGGLAAARAAGSGRRRRRGVGLAVRGFVRRRTS